MKTNLVEWINLLSKVKLSEHEDFSVKAIPKIQEKLEFVSVTLGSGSIPGIIIKENLCYFNIAEKTLEELIITIPNVGQSVVNFLHTIYAEEKENGATCWNYIKSIKRLEKEVLQSDNLTLPKDEALLYLHIIISYAFLKGYF